ncbi:MAG TPA: hypothetical protein VGG08_08985 [Solirubrobacteraceae bacterium]
MELLALIASERRALLLRVHRHRLRHEDLEDCYGQAVVELLAYVRRGGTFAGSSHLARMLEQRFLSRIADRRRAMLGRSSIQAAVEAAVALDDDTLGKIEIADRRYEPERLAMAREELRAVFVAMGRLTADQRSVLLSQAGSEPVGAFRARTAWSGEKYRKVAQRGRASLRSLLAVPSEPTLSEERAGHACDSHPPNSS